MFVKVNGEQIEVAVSDGGVFYDVKTKKVSAKSLKAITTKLRAALTITHAIPVEQAKDGKQGTVIGRVTNKGYRSHYYRVRWDNSNDISEVSEYDLRRLTTTDEKKKLLELQAKSNSTRQVYEKASMEYSNFIQSLILSPQLHQIFS